MSGKPPRSAIERGSGNVFVDLGLPDAAERLEKAEVLRRVRRHIRGRNLTRPQAAAVLGVSAGVVRHILLGGPRRFTLDALKGYEHVLQAPIRATYPPRRKLTDRPRSRPLVA